jgi:triacylglycerol esterase/lipase EstA (alpha/beta hydrolase family)
MLARLQRLISLGLLAVILGALWLAVQLDIPALWATPAIVIAVYTTVLGTEFWRLRRSYDVSDADRPTAAQLVRACAAELLVAPCVFLWRQPFRSTVEPDHLPDGGRGRRGVLFVHGFFCNRGLWNPWLHRLRMAGVAFIAVNLEPLFGSIDDYASTIDAAVRDLERTTGTPPVIVAHSMGGLAVRSWLAVEGRSKRFHHVVTIATPHAGTHTARRGFGVNVGQMRTTDPWLWRLLVNESATVRERFVCFWGHCDNIVFPTRNATLAGADNRHLPATPHVRMAYHPAVFDEVLRLVDAGEPKPSVLHSDRAAVPDSDSGTRR